MDESCRQSLRAAAAAAAAARAAGASSCMRPRTPLRLCLALALLMFNVVAQAAEVSLCLSPSTLCCMHLPVVVFPAEAVDESPVLDHTKLPACLIGKQHVSRISRTPLHQQEGTGEELVFVEPAYAVPADNYTAVRWCRALWQRCSPARLLAACSATSLLSACHLCCAPSSPVHLPCARPHPCRLPALPGTNRRSWSACPRTPPAPSTARATPTARSLRYPAPVRLAGWLAFLDGLAVGTLRSYRGAMHAAAAHSHTAAATDVLSLAHAPPCLALLQLWTFWAILGFPLSTTRNTAPSCCHVQTKPAARCLSTRPGGTGRPSSAQRVWPAPRASARCVSRTGEADRQPPTACAWPVAGDRYIVHARVCALWHRQLSIVLAGGKLLNGSPR